MVRDHDSAALVGQCDAVDRPVDQSPHQRRVALGARLALFELRDVDDEPLPVGALSVGNVRRGVTHPDTTLVRADQPVVAVEVLVRGDRGGVALDHTVVIVGVQRTPP